MVLGTTLIGCTPVLAQAATPTDAPAYQTIRLVADTIPPPPRSPFSALSPAIQNFDSGFGLSGGLLHQHYVEDQAGKTLDAEHGSIPVVRLFWHGQWDHFGVGVTAQYATGSDTYDGALQSCTASGCTLTPVTSSTGNKILDLTVDADYAFSPLAHLAVLPGVFIGQHVWLRDLHGKGGYNERYSDHVVGAQIGVQYRLGRFLLGLRGRYGTTLSPHQTATITPATFNLGSNAYSSVRLRVTWAATPRIHLFMGDEYSGFSYGESQKVPVGGGLALQEPHSRTQQNVIEFGVTVQ